jgi:hypothetical protein
MKPLHHIGNLLLPALAALWLVLAGCAHDDRTKLSGKYITRDGFGVLVFRPDGTFGYSFATKFDFYDTHNLPPRRAQYRLGLDGHAQVFGLLPGYAPFTLEVQDGGKSLRLVAQETNGCLPDTEIYYKR